MAMFVGDSPSFRDDDKLFPYEGAPRRQPPRRFIFPPLDMTPERPLRYTGPPVIDLSAPDDVFATDLSPPPTPLDVLPSPAPQEDVYPVVPGQPPTAHASRTTPHLFPPLSAMRARPLASTRQGMVPVGVVPAHVRTPIDAETTGSDSLLDWTSDGLSPDGSLSEEEVEDRIPFQTYFSGLSATEESAASETRNNSDAGEGPSWQPLRSGTAATSDTWLSDSDSQLSLGGTGHHYPSLGETDFTSEEDSSLHAVPHDMLKKRKRHTTTSSSSEARERQSRHHTASSRLSSPVIISSDSDSEEDMATITKSDSQTTHTASAPFEDPSDDPSTSATSLSSRSCDSSSGEEDAAHALTSTPPLSGNGNYNWPWLE
ncbi:tegument protein G45 [Colobine gammaherpesvirus 1]|uniref:Tegument protein G45 n=1 Tax=Colobine gammaherpesvirus 1 TaxID=2597325 RepID=A0A5B8FKG1_9GAMA|nr:tegument protein G45 [Colobine gammaherpesvirus 1]QDQ69252.1 tegument protein G45 [Colobine gammaherpesvirus 1]